MEKDWTGNRKSIFVTLGAGGKHSSYERIERDFYATDPIAIKMLYQNHWNDCRFSNNIWECACGNGHLVNGLKEVNPKVKIKCSDIVVRDFPCSQTDFLKCDTKFHNGDIITNPPYKYAIEFVKKGLELVDETYNVAMFLKLTFLEGKERRKFFNKFPPKWVIVSSQRIRVARNGDPEMFKKSSAACYAWFIWRKGHTTPPIIKWL